MTKIKTAFGVTRKMVQAFGVTVVLCSVSLETLEDSVVDTAYQLGVMLNTIVEEVKLDFVMSGF